MTEQKEQALNPALEAERPPVLETERLCLRGWQPDDLEDLYEFASYKGDGPKQGWKPHESREDSRRRLDSLMKDRENWAIVLKKDHKVIGWVKMNPDENRGRYYAKYVSYVLSKDYRGDGYMTGALNRIIRYAFEEQHVDLLSAFHYPDNIPSKRVLERCGFLYEITLEKTQTGYDGQLYDAVCYSLLAKDYFAGAEREPASV